MKTKVAVGDADALIALVYQNDAHHVRAKNISKALLDRGYAIIFPNTALLEAITALKRSLDLVEEAHLINRQYLQNELTVEYISEEIQKRASERFEKTKSKKNTIFDAIVIETALALEADYIFSFDDWYRKEGFQLVPEE